MSGTCTPKRSSPGRDRHRSPSVVLINDDTSLVTEAMASLDAQPPARRRHTANAQSSTSNTATSSLSDRCVMGTHATNTISNARKVTTGKTPRTRSSPSSTRRNQPGTAPPRLDTRAIFGTNTGDPEASLRDDPDGAGRTLWSQPPRMGAFPKGKVIHAIASAQNSARPVPATHQPASSGDRKRPPVAPAATRTHDYEYDYHVHPLYPRTGAAAPNRALTSTRARASSPPPTTSVAAAARPVDTRHAHTVSQLFNHRTSLIEQFVAATGVKSAVPGRDGRIRGVDGKPTGDAGETTRDSWSSDDENDVPDPLKPLQGAVGQGLYLRRAPEYDPAHPLAADSTAPFSSTVRLQGGSPLPPSTAAPGGDPAKTDNPLFHYLSNYKMGDEAPLPPPPAPGINAAFDASASPLHSAMKQTSPPNAQSTATAAVATGGGGTEQTAGDGPSAPPPPPPPLPPASNPAPGENALLSPKTVRFADEVPLPPPPSGPVPLPGAAPAEATSTTAVTTTTTASATQSGAEGTANTGSAAPPPPPPPPPVPVLSPEEKARQEAEQAELKLLTELAEADARLQARERARVNSAAAPSPSALEDLLGSPQPTTAGSGNVYGWHAPPANVVLPSVFTSAWQVPTSTHERLVADEARAAALALVEAEKHHQMRRGRVDGRGAGGGGQGGSDPRSPSRQRDIAQLVRDRQKHEGEVDYQACFEDVFEPERVTAQLYASMEEQARDVNAAAGAGVGARQQSQLHDALPPPTDSFASRNASGSRESSSTLATQAVILRNAVSLLACEHLEKDVGTEWAMTQSPLSGNRDATLQTAPEAFNTLFGMRSGPPRGPSQSTAITSSVLHPAPPVEDMFCELSYPAKVLLSAILYVRALGGLPTLLRVQPLTTFSPVVDKSNCLELVFVNPAKALAEEARRVAAQEAEAQRERARILQQQPHQALLRTTDASPLPLGRQRGRSAPPTSAAGSARRSSFVETQLLSTLSTRATQRRRSSSSFLTGIFDPGASMSLSAPGHATPLREPSFADIPFVSDEGHTLPPQLSPATSVSFSTYGTAAGAAPGVSSTDNNSAVFVPLRQAPPPQPSILRRMGSERRSAPRVDVAPAQGGRRTLRRSSSALPLREPSAEDTPAAVDVGRSGETPRTTSAAGSTAAPTAAAAKDAKDAQWRSAVSAALQSANPTSAVWNMSGSSPGAQTPLPAPKPPSTPTGKGAPLVDPAEDELCVVVRAVLANKSVVHRFGTSEVVHVLPPLPRPGESLEEKVARANATSSGVEGLVGSRTAAVLGESGPLAKIMADEGDSAAQRRTNEARRKQYLREQMKRQNARGPLVINEDGKPTAEDYGDLIVALLLSGSASPLSGLLPDAMELESLRYKIFSLQGYSAHDPFGINRKRPSSAAAAASATDAAAATHAFVASSPAFGGRTPAHPIASMTSLFGVSSSDNPLGGVGARRSRAGVGAAAGVEGTPDASFSALLSGVSAQEAWATRASGHGDGIHIADNGERAEKQRVRAESARLERGQKQFPLYRASSVSESTLQAYHQQRRKRGGASAASPAAHEETSSSAKNDELREAEQELVRFRPLRLDCFYSELVDAVQFALDMQVRQTKEKVMQAFHM